MNQSIVADNKQRNYIVIAAKFSLKKPLANHCPSRSNANFLNRKNYINNEFNNKIA